MLVRLDLHMLDKGSFECYLTLTTLLPHVEVDLAAADAFSS
jgi:hypothetical protein